LRQSLKTFLSELSQKNFIFQKKIKPLGCKSGCVQKKSKPLCRKSPQKQGLASKRRLGWVSIYGAILGLIWAF
jgi:hypothetical protein